VAPVRSPLAICILPLSSPLSPHLGTDEINRMFNQQEVQILLGGVNTPIDLQDLRNNTNYGGLYGPSHPVILLFWKVRLLSTYTYD
jgi:hypothetical protein